MNLLVCADMPVPTTVRSGQNAFDSVNRCIGSNGLRNDAGHLGFYSEWTAGLAAIKGYWRAVIGYHSLTLLFPFVFIALKGGYR